MYGPASQRQSAKSKIRPATPHAAGIDVGAREIYVAVPPGRDPRPVRSFPTFTADLHRLRDWLYACGVTTVAIESTGVYWMPLFQILETAEIEVYLVNARHCKNLPGRKTDVQDCQWLQQLHAVGLLRGSFRPAEQVCAVRAILRHRDALVRGASRCVSHLHKALTQMNVQLQHVISDLTGVTGLAILAFLEAYHWITLHAINPLTLQKYREAFVTSRAKDDAKDARYLAELLWHHSPELPVWAPEDPATRKLQLLVSHRRAVVDERTGLTNRLQALLKQYFPQALELCGEELWRPLATTFLLKWPTLQQVAKAKVSTLVQFYHVQGSRSEQAIERRLSLIEQAVPLTDEPALLESFTLRVQLICRELKLVVNAIKDYDRQIAQAFAQHPDREIFRHLPGAGPTFAPRLLASLGSQRERFANAAALQHYSGIAPVTKQSGGKRHVHRRYLCPKFLRQSFHEYAKESILHSRWAAAYYQQQREQGSPHHTAVRALAFKWQRIIFRLWQDKTVYREEIYEAALRKTGSALVARFDHIEVGNPPFKNPTKKI